MFKNKSYIIFGGSSGIGLATAEALVKEDAHVTIAGRSEQKLLMAQERLGSKVTRRALDIAQEENVASLFASIADLDGIVCTAGETPPGSIDDVDTSVAKHGFDAKFWGQYFIVKHGRKKLNSHGSIVLSSGVFSVRPTKNVSILAAVNGALEGFVRAMAVELAPIRINLLAPGFIDTPRLQKVSAKNAQAFSERLERDVPLKRVGEPQEAAHSMLYLLSNGYVTGSTLYLDGGISLR